MNAFLKKKNLRLPLPQARRGFSVHINKRILGGIAALVVFIAFLNFFNQPIKNSFYYLTSPISKTFWQAGENAASFFAPLFDTLGIVQENNNLKQENQNLLSQISLLQETIKADQAIQSAIENTQADKFTLVLAQTISLDADNDFLIINKGADNGISENMPVISSTKVLFGKVFRVYKNFSQVMLISSKSSVADSKILNQDALNSPIYGAIKGNGNLSLYLDLVASDAKISQGDVLNTSGLEGVFPKDLLIGKITSVDKSDLKPFQTAQVQPLFDIKNADNLFIITDYKKQK